MAISKRVKLIETFLNDPKDANTTFAIKHKMMYSKKQIAKWLSEITEKVRLDIYVITDDNDKALSIIVRGNGGYTNNPILNFDYNTDSQVINGLLLVGEMVTSGNTYNLRYVKVNKIRDFFEAQLTGKTHYTRVLPGLAKLPFEDLYRHMVDDYMVTSNDFKHMFEGVRVNTDSNCKDVSYSVTKDPNKKIWVNIPLDGEESFKDRLTNVDYSKLDDLMKVRLWLHANKLTLDYFDIPEDVITEKLIDTKSDDHNLVMKQVDFNPAKLHGLDDPHLSTFGRKTVAVNGMKIVGGYPSENIPTAREIFDMINHLKNNSYRPDPSIILARENSIDNLFKDQLKKGILEIIDNNDIDSEIVIKLLDIVIEEAGA